MKTTTKTKHAKDVWKAYALQLLGLNAEWWGVYHNKIHNYYVYRNVLIDGKPTVEEVFSYGLFKQIVDEFFIAAKQEVIAGSAVNLGNHIGKVCARRVERDHGNKQINWGRTRLQPLIEKDGKMVPKNYIYHIDDDYCRIGFHKTGRVKNETVYEFAPTEDNKMGTGFKQEFTKALRSNTLLKYRFLFQPLKKETKKALKEDSADYKQLKLATA